MGSKKPDKAGVRESYFCPLRIFLLKEYINVFTKLSRIVEDMKYFSLPLYCRLKEKSLSLLSKKIRERIIYAFLLSCHFTISLPPSLVSFTVLTLCLCTPVMSHVGKVSLCSYQYQQNRTLFCLPYLVLSRGKHIIVVGRNNKLCTHFVHQQMNEYLC